MTAFASDADRREKLVQPFYLQMMGLNAIRHGAGLAAEVSAAGRATLPTDVIGLLRIGWRECVMGAWLALCHEDPRVVEAVLQALTTSQGNLDAPPLAVVAVVPAGTGAVPALESYYHADRAHEWGASGFAAAAIGHLRKLGRAESRIPAPAADDAAAFIQLLAVAN